MAGRTCPLRPMRGHVTEAFVRGRSGPNSGVLAHILYELVLGYTSGGQPAQIGSQYRQITITARCSEPFTHPRVQHCLDTVLWPDAVVLPRARFTRLSLLFFGNLLIARLAFNASQFFLL